MQLAERGTRVIAARCRPRSSRSRGIDLYSAGEFHGTEHAEDIVLRDPGRDVYKRLIVRDNKLRGAVLFGDASAGPWYAELIEAGKDVGELRDRLLFGPDEHDAGRPHDVPLLRRGVRSHRAEAARTGRGRPGIRRIPRIRGACARRARRSRIRSGRKTGCCIHRLEGPRFAGSVRRGTKRSGMSRRTSRASCASMGARPWRSTSRASCSPRITTSPTS